MEGDANDNSQDVDEENHVKSISLHTLFENQCSADSMPILEFCPSKIRNDSFNLDNQPRLNHMNNTIRHVQNRVTAMKPCYGKFLCDHVTHNQSSQDKYLRQIPESGNQIGRSALSLDSYS